MTKMRLPESCSCLTPLYSGALFCIDDWRCNGHDTTRKHEHWCADDRIVITRRGVWELTTESHKQFADPLSVIFWNANTHFSVQHPIGGTDDCTVIRLTAKGTEAMRTASSKLIMSDATFEPISKKLSKHTFGLHWKLLMQARTQSITNPQAVEQCGVDFILELAANEIVVPNQNDGKPIAQHAREIIARRYTEPLPLNELAQIVGCSSFYLARQFKKSFGISPHQAQIIWRLRTSLTQVLDQPDRLTDIALNLGFASHSHFTDAFREYYGCSPQHARNFWLKGLKN